MTCSDLARTSQAAYSIMYAASKAVNRSAEARWFMPKLAGELGDLRESYADTIVNALDLASAGAVRTSNR